MQYEPFRVPHWLTGNHGTWVPSQLVVVETTPVRIAEPDEQDKELHRLGLGAAYYRRLRSGDNGGEWCDFATASQFWEWCLIKPRLKSSLWIAGHGLIYQLTMLGFWDLLDKGILTLNVGPWAGNMGAGGGRDDDGKPGQLCVLNDPPTIILCRYEKTLITLVDTRNYFAGTLEDLAVDVGLKLLPRPSEMAVDTDWHRYLGARAQVSCDALIGLMRWWDKAELGSWRYTAPSLAWHSYRHRWVATPKVKKRAVREGGERRKWATMKVSILIDGHPEAAELGRAALAAGECRLWRAGPVGSGPILTYHGRQGGLPKGFKSKAGPVFVVDVAGFYASLMRDHSYPCELVAVVPTASAADLEAWSKYLDIIAECRIATTERTYPVMIDKRRHYALGVYNTALASPELLQALRTGDLRGVGRVALYRRSKLFGGYVDHFWSLRQEYAKADKRAHAAFAKLMLVSLSGRWAQMTSKWVDTSEVHDVHRWGPWSKVDADTGELLQCRSLAGHVQQRNDYGETDNSFPAIAACILSYGRVRMAELRAVAGEEEVYYQATDALHLSQLGYERLCEAGLVHPGQLGKLSLTGMYGCAEYRGPMDYTVGGEHVVSGLKPDRHQVERRVYEQLVFEGIDAVTERGPRSYVSMRVERRRLGPLHVGGILHSDGRVTPPVVMEGQLLQRPAEAAAALEDMRRNCTSTPLW